MSGVDGYVDMGDGCMDEGPEGISKAVIAEDDPFAREDWTERDDAGLLERRPFVADAGVRLAELAFDGPRAWPARRAAGIPPA